MSTFKRFEDIEVWKKSRELTSKIYIITQEGKFYKDFNLRDQIRRACISVMSNIAEGFNRQTKKEFIQFLSIAKGSIAEIQSQLYIALDLDYITKDQFDNMYVLCDQIASMLHGLMIYLSRSPLQGKKYRNNSQHSNTKL